MNKKHWEGWPIMRDLRESKYNRSQSGKEETGQTQKQAPKQQREQDKGSPYTQNRQTAQNAGYGCDSAADKEEFRRKYGKNVTDSQWKQFQDMQKKTEQYKGKSEKEMMDEITRMAAQERAKGTLNNEQLERFAATVRPMMNATQQQKLKQILDSLK